MLPRAARFKWSELDTIMSLERVHKMLALPVRLETASDTRIDYQGAGVEWGYVRSLTL
jgi:hypothetical protein